MTNLLTDAQNQACNISIVDYTYNPTSKQLSVNGQTLDIEPRSIELLEVLLSSIGEPISGDEIIHRVWESEYISKNVLTNRISTLRALFKQHSSHPDADKIIVTYPKKGYYLQTELVHLKTTSASGLNEPSTALDAESSIGKSTSTTQILWIHIGYICTLISILMAGGWLYHNKADSYQPNHHNYSDQVLLHPSSEHEAQATIPVVDILLNTIKAKDDFARSHLKEVKVRILSQTLNYPFIDLKNQDSPSYFLDPIDQSIYWPGGRNVLNYDYKLNLTLQESNPKDGLNLILELIYQGSNKLAFQSEFTLDPKAIDAGLQAVSQTIAHYLSLPELTHFDTKSGEISRLITSSAETLIQTISEQEALSRLEIEYIARKAFLSDTLSSSELMKVINTIESYVRYPTEEIGIWLGLLHYKVSDHEQALEYLNKEQAYNRIHNAYLYLILSDIALKQDHINSFRLFYLRSVEALSEAISSEAMFRRLTKTENKESCLAPWLSLSFNETSSVQRQHHKEGFIRYCNAVDKHLTTLLSK